MTDPTGFPLAPRGPGASGRGPEDVRLRGAGRPRATAAAPGRDPFDLESALNRLKTLLAFDGPNGPRDGVPPRGFYLNILA